MISRAVEPPYLWNRPSVELNNELRIAEQAEWEEIQRILKRLSSAVATSLSRY